MLVRCLAPPSLSVDCRSRLFLSSVPERCNTNSTPAGLRRWELRTGLNWRCCDRASSGGDRNRPGPARFAFGRRRLLFGRRNDRVHGKLSPPSRVLLRKPLPSLSVPRLINGKQFRLQGSKLLGAIALLTGTCPRNLKLLNTRKENVVVLGILGNESSSEKQGTDDKMYAVINFSQHQRPNMQVSHCEPYDSKKQIDQAEESAKGFCTA